jgi:hypothetical protein
MQHYPKSKPLQNQKTFLSKVENKNVIQFVAGDRRKSFFVFGAQDSDYVQRRRVWLKKSPSCSSSHHQSECKISKLAQLILCTKGKAGIA